MKLDFSRWWSLIKQTGVEWLKDRAPSMGAALSYYTVFSLAPLLLLVISIAGLIFGHDAAQGALFAQLGTLMGDEAAKGVQALLASVSKPSEGIIGTVVGVAILLVGATTVFGELQDSLDLIWQAPEREGGGLWGLIRTRLLSFGMILGIAFLLMVSLVLGAVVAALGKWSGALFGGWEFLAQAMTFLLGFVMTTGVFAMIYKLLPRVDVRWHDVWIGAVVTSLLFNIGRFLIGLYIGKSGVASGFGAAGSIIVVFVWVYYSAQIFLLGAEFTWVYATEYGSRKNLPKLKANDTKRTADSSKNVASPSPASSQPASASAPLSIDVPRVVNTEHSAGVLIAKGAAIGVALRYVIPWLLRRR
ncbi:MAG: YihY/virulence factor BrkB family protein [Pseudomonadota bacterium]|nr:YihY/virulence factor BrkB family protein [Pseudomonadota bacterium]